MDWKDPGMIGKEITQAAFKAGEQQGIERGQQRSIDALNAYTGKKISLEKCAELMDINIYELIAAFRRWESTLG